MPERASPLLRLLVVARDLLRGAFGTGGYECYRAHHATHHPDEPPLERVAYFRQRQHERWNGISRCC